MILDELRFMVSDWGSHGGDVPKAEEPALQALQALQRLQGLGADEA